MMKIPCMFARQGWANVLTPRLYGATQHIDFYSKQVLINIKLNTELREELEESDQLILRKAHFRCVKFGERQCRIPKKTADCGFY